MRSFSKLLALAAAAARCRLLAAGASLEAGPVRAEAQAQEVSFSSILALRLLLIVGRCDERALRSRLVRSCKPPAFSLSQGCCLKTASLLLTASWQVRFGCIAQRLPAQSVYSS